MNVERLSQITVEEGKRGGRPCIRGLRMRVKEVPELLSAAPVEREGIFAATEYAALQTDHAVLRT